MPRRAVTIERSPSIQFYFRQFAGDEQVLAMDLDCIGAHMLLMCAAGASPEGYRIPNNERLIRNLIRNPNGDDWARIKSELLSGAWKISDDEKWWVQDGLQRSLLKQKQFRELQSSKARHRWGTTKHMPRHETGSTEAMPSSSSSSSSSPSGRKGVGSQDQVVDSQDEKTPPESPKNHKAENPKVAAEKRSLERLGYDIAKLYPEHP